MISRYRFKYEAPCSLETAAEFFQRRDNVTILAGGTDLIPLMQYGVKKPECLLDLENISSLKTIEKREDGLLIGAMVTLFELTKDPVILQHMPALSYSAFCVASPQIRNLGTIAGNVLQEKRCYYYNQSEEWRKSKPPCIKVGGEICYQAPKLPECRALYYSDLAPVLLAYDAKVLLYDADGEKTVLLQDLLNDYLSEKGKNYLITGILIPYHVPGTWDKFIKYSTRQSIDFPTVNVAVRFSPVAEGLAPIVRIFVGALAKEPIQLEKTADYILSNIGVLEEEEVKKKVIDMALEEVKGKRAVVRETGVTIKVKRESYQVITRAIEELLDAIKRFEG
ncbi:MAG: hypothetical protein GX939_00710 [Clostridiaceae bacterium]|jgi:4-hydroxybenzoyl-CoA reductase subunit beta|nr:hypothetical protein [Clostridiaceae bacterium]